MISTTEAISWVPLGSQFISYRKRWWTRSDLSGPFLVLPSDTTRISHLWLDTIFFSHPSQFYWVWGRITNRFTFLSFPTDSCHDTLCRMNLCYAVEMNAFNQKEIPIFSDAWSNIILWNTHSRHKSNNCQNQYEKKRLYIVSSMLQSSDWFRAFQFNTFVTFVIQNNIHSLFKKLGKRSRRNQLHWIELLSNHYDTKYGQINLGTIIPRRS